MVKYLVLFVCLSYASVPITEILSSPAINHDIINTVNNDPTLNWNAGINSYFINATLRDARRLCGTRTDINPLPIKHIKPFTDIPSEFDPRKVWPYCSSLNEIRDQGPCGSCWAISSAEVMTDRICITSKGKINNIRLGTEDILSCCDFCGSGCEGGFPSGAFSYWARNGVVTGGTFEDQKFCYPYAFAQCEHHTEGSKPKCADTQPTPRCTPSCKSSYGKQYSQDKHFADKVYGVHGEENIQTEIMKNGPLGTAFTVYEDFMHYKSGIYQHKTGFMLGGHAVKMFGWGEENGQKYWLVANSWNEDWGLKGFFKIRRGVNECGIEEALVGGIPRL